VGAQFLGGTAEWAAVIALLVYAFERGGARATGLTSLATFVAPLLAAPIIAVAGAAHRLQVIRRTGLAMCAVFCLCAGLAAMADMPLVVVVACGVVALGGLTVLAATGSSLVPAAVHTPRELVVANLWLGHCSAVCVLIGPLFATAVLALGTPASTLLGCAGLMLAAFALTCIDPGPPAHPPTVHPVRGAVDAARSLVRRPGGPGLMAVSFARNALVGALDVLMVVVAFDAIDIGGTGAALLNAAFGAGAVCSVFAATLALRGTRLAPAIIGATASTAVLCAVLAGTLDVVPAFLIVAALGLAAALVNTLSRMMLQRCADPRSLGQVFSLLALTDGVALIAGSVVAQVVLAAADVEAALLAVGGLLGLLSVGSLRSVWRADASADVPVAPMSLLRHTSTFDALPPLELESLARSAVYLEVDRGSVVIRQGDVGDRYYVVSAGEFDVEMNGRHMRTARRGEAFGEVALLADVPRTATVTAATPGVLLSVDRVAFLTALTGSDTSRQAAWGVVRAMELDTPLPAVDRVPD
jgi:hypothetical protein